MDSNLLFINFKKYCVSVRRGVCIIAILIESGITMALVRLIKMHLNETHSKVRLGNHIPISFLFKPKVK